MESLNIDFTVKEITTWGGLVLFRQMNDKMAFNDDLQDSRCHNRVLTGDSSLSCWF